MTDRRRRERESPKHDPVGATSHPPVGSGLRVLKLARPLGRGFVGILATIALLFTEPALAHGFGNRYDLAIPTEFFYLGSVLVVGASFVLVSVFADGGSGGVSSSAVRRTVLPVRFPSGGWAVHAVETGVVLLLLVGILAGLLGPQEYYDNVYTLLVWVVWWVGYTLSVALVGNTWSVVNPWKTFYDRMVGLVGYDPSLRCEYRWGALPAVTMLFAFGWLEIVSPISASPRGMVLSTLVYSAVTWLGMLVYGPTTWLNEADPFARFYRYLGRFAPLSARDGGEVRMYGSGLVERDDSLEAAGAASFVVLVLYLVTFDGFIATPAWRALALWFPRLPVPYLATTALMLAGLAALVEAYLTVAKAIDRAAGGEMGEHEVARRFALSLLPIAVGYFVSLYYAFLLVRGQFVLPALADPFGWGWDLLGLGGFEPAGRLPFLTVRSVWISQVALVVIGHVVAVWVAHHIALEAFEDRRTAVKSQLPMMALMIAYTALSLWILALPVIEPPLP